MVEQEPPTPSHEWPDDLKSVVVDLIGAGFSFGTVREYDMALEWAIRAYRAGREATTLPSVVRAYWAGREDVGVALEAYAGNYPENVFPATSDSRDAIGGTAMRHAYRNAARIAREGESDG